MKHLNHYLSPEMQVCEMEAEGILCSSAEDANQIFDSLQDYEPSEGEW